MIAPSWYNLSGALASAVETTGATFLNDFPKREMDSSLLPIKTNLPVSLANVFTFKFTVSLNFERV